MSATAKKMKTIVSFASEDVFNRARAEGNTSALVEALLAQHYGIKLPTDSVQAQMRHAALGAVQTEEVKSEPAATENPDISKLIGGTEGEPTVADAKPSDEVGNDTNGDNGAEPAAPVKTETPPAENDQNQGESDEDNDPADGDLDDEFLDLPPKPQPMSNDFADLGATADTGVPAPAPAPEPEPEVPSVPAEPEIPFQPIIKAQAEAVPAEPTNTQIDPASGIMPPADGAEPMVEPVQEEAPQYNAGDKVCPTCGKNFAPLPYCLDCL